MASLHRKLLHKPKPSVCPTGCSRGDPLNNGCIRQCFAIPPPPPPPPPPPLIHGSSNHAHFPPSLFITLYSFPGFVLLISISFILWKMCSRRNSSDPAEVDTTSDDNNDTENFWENHHHVWLINTVGLPQSAIDLIAVCKFKPGDGLIEGTECSVCLSEFEEDENLRLLPKCSHGFHLPCIDPWLRSHKNCPLCRAPVEIDAKINSDSYRHSDDSAVAEESQVENHGNFENRGEGGGIGIGIGSNESVDLGSGSENGGIAGDARAGEVKNPNSNSNSNSGFVEKKRSGSSRLLGCELMKSCSLGRSRNLQMGSVSMKRSFSSGRLLFVSREKRRKRSASTLIPF